MMFTRVLWIFLLVLVPAGCRTPEDYRQDADDAAYNIIDRAQQAALGKREGFDVRPPADDLRERLLVDQYLPQSTGASQGAEHVDPIDQLPDRGYLARDDEPRTPPWLDRVNDRALVISLEEALLIGARNSRDYQTQKEQVFISALSLDLEQDEFRTSWAGLLSTEGIVQAREGEDTAGIIETGTLSLGRRFQNGMVVTARLGIDLVQLLTGSESSSMGVFGDASVAIPLMRGSSRFVVTEPLRQAERDVIYSIYDFERFKRVFGVRVASAYFDVLQQLDSVRNAEENYRGLVNSVRRVRRLADEGRLPEIQVDQAVQDELRSRDRWISALQSYERQLDAFKLLLGLPTDALIELDRSVLDELAVLEETAVATMPATQGQSQATVDADAPIELSPPDREQGGPYEIDPLTATLVAMNRRLDLRIAIGLIDDAQRNIVVAADNLRADLTLLGSVSVGERRGLGSADADNGEFRLDRATYSGLFELDLPLERTAERNAYRLSWLRLEQQVRGAQELEDRIKLDVREALRTLLQARESIAIQARSVELAESRVRSTTLFLDLGRAEVRDVLEAREDLIGARNALTSALIRYRLAELELQRDLGVLEIGADGLWREVSPEALEELIEP